MKKSMFFDDAFLETLLAEAVENPRKRQNFDLRTSGKDGSQRMFNALQPGTEVPVHRHTDTAETVFCIRGNVEEILFELRDGEMVETERVQLNPSEGLYGMQISAGVWHTIRVMTPSVIVEMKDGAFVPRAASDVWEKK